MLYIYIYIYDLACSLSWRMFHEHLRKMYVLLLSGVVYSII